MRTPRGLPSASKLELALACAGSTVLPVVDTAWKAGSDGNDKHAALAHEVDPAEVAPTVSPSTAAWLASLKDDAETLAPLRGSLAEVTVAWNHATGAGRILGQRLERAYGAATPTEYVGTADYLRLDPGRVLVADLKTGEAEQTHPSRNAQLRFLALAACRAHGVEAATVGILHAPEGRAPRWMWAHFDAFELEVVADELRGLAKRIAAARGADARGASPWLRVGEHCQWCPARHACPGRVAMARAMATAPEGFAADLKRTLDDDTTAAAALERWKAARKVLDEVSAALYARAKDRPIPLGDGRVWGPVETQREVIDAEAAWPILDGLLGSEGVKAALTVETSKAGVERGVKAAKAAGKLSGTIKAGTAQVMDALRAAGAVTTKTRTEYQEHTVAPLGIGPGGERDADGEAA